MNGLEMHENELNDLKRQKFDVDQKINAMQEEMREDVVAKIKVLMFEHDISAEHLGLISLNEKTKKRSGDVYFKNEATGKEWFGIGRKPNWVIEQQCFVEGLSTCFNPVVEIIKR